MMVYPCAEKLFVRPSARLTEITVFLNIFGRAAVFQQAV